MPRSISTTRNPKIEVQRYHDLFLKLQNQKTQNRLKISKSILRDFSKSTNQMEHEESENPAHEAPGYTLQESEYLLLLEYQGYSLESRDLNFQIPRVRTDLCTME